MTEDLRRQLETCLGDTYRIERELGGGGMSRVFLASETALERTVVIKVLSPELAAGVSAQRFDREVRLAASLQQANIVPVLASGDADGLPWYAMPYVDGESLRDNLTRGGRLQLADAVDVLKDIVRALAFAHAHGVVHRDIKPENVLLSGGAAVVTDFGIARAISAARTGTPAAPHTTLTEVGTAIGTPAYMAPEQIAGDPDIDHRADLYSFGCLAYELISGDAPFAGRTASRLLAAHISESPVPLGERCPDCPEPLASLVMGCLEKDPADRPQSARELVPRLSLGGGSSTGVSGSRIRFSRAQLAGVAVLLGVMVAIPLVRGWQRGPATGSVASLAVLPFTSLGDSANEYLAAGLADELATSLGKIAGVRVISRSLSGRYGGRSDVDARSVGQALEADYILQGTVRPGADQLRVSAQLVRAEDNTEAWSETYTRPASDAFLIHDSIARAVGLTLQRAVSRPGPAAGIPGSARSGTDVPEAYDLYLRGRRLLERRGPGVALAVERFEQAIALDSGYARAHAALGVALELLPYFSDTRAVTVRDRAMRAAQRALALDSTQAEAYTALGLAHEHGYEWSRAATAHRNAVRWNPEDASAHVQYGRFLFYTGQFAAALAQFTRARTLDPYSAVASAWVGHLQCLQNRCREGLAELARALELDSLNPPALVMASLAHLHMNARDSSRMAAERLARRVPTWRAEAAHLQALLGEDEEARRVLDQVEAGAVPGERYTRIYLIALALGDTTRALEALERGTDAGEIWPVWYSLSERAVDRLRGSARFAAVVGRVGLDARLFTGPTGGRPR